MDFSVGLKISSGQRRDEHGFDSRCSRLLHIAAQVGFVLRHSRLAWEVVLALEIVVSELNEHVVGLCLEAPFPEALLAKGFGAGTTLCHIYAVDLRSQIGAETSSIPCVVGLGGVADEINSYCRS